MHTRTGPARLEPGSPFSYARNGNVRSSGFDKDKPLDFFEITLHFMGF
jgi:hypothetical protein